MKKTEKVSMVGILIIMIMVVMTIVGVNPVKASIDVKQDLILDEKPIMGSLTANITKYGTYPCAMMGHSDSPESGLTWNEMLYQSLSIGSIEKGSPSEISITSDSVVDKWSSVRRIQWAFDITSQNITDLGQISIATIYAELNYQFCTFTISRPAISLYISGSQNEPVDGWWYGSPPDDSQWYVMRGGSRVTDEIVRYNEYDDGDYLEFPLDTGYWSQVFRDTDDDGVYDICFVYVNETNYDHTGGEPYYQASKTMGFNFTGSDIYLWLEYTGELPDRRIDTDDLPENDDEVENPTTDNVTDNITWCSPRLAYGDDDPSFMFDVAGETGAMLDLDVIDYRGSIIGSLSHTDSIRVDGHYYYEEDLPDNFNGLFRLKENYSNVVSSWGYCKSAPDETQELNTIVLNEPTYHHWDNEFDEFAYGEEEIYSVHWCTNMDEDDLDYASIELWEFGDKDEVIWTENMSVLRDEYYQNIECFDEYIPWRYALFVMNKGSGFEDYDGLILDINTNYGYDTAGFYQFALVEDATDEEFTQTEDLAFYLTTPEIDGIRLTTNKRDYSASENIRVLIEAGTKTKIRDYLSSIKVEMVKDSGIIMDTENAVMGGEVESIDIIAPGSRGNYYIRLTLTDEDVTGYYIHQVPITVEGGVAGYDEDDASVTDVGRSILDNIKDFFIDLGFEDSSILKWIIMCGLMLIVFILCRDDKFWRVILPLLIMGIFIIANWVDVWLIVLLSLGVGVILIGIMNKLLKGEKVSRG